MGTKLAVVVSFIIALVAGIPAGAQEATDLRIGVIAPMSGPVPIFGTAIKNGVDMAVKEWNDKGGVLGRRIRAIIEDGQCTPDPAVQAAQKLITQDRVHYIIGEVCSMASIPVSEIATLSHVIQITPTSTNKLVTVDRNGRVKPYIFRACFIDPFQGTVAAKFAVNRLSAGTAFILYDESNDYVSGLAASFEEAFVRLGGTVVGKLNYTSVDTDFSALLSHVKSQNPDVIYFPDYYNIVNIAIKQARKMGMTAPFLGGDGWDSSDLDLATTEGCYFTNHYSPDDPRPEAQTFEAAFAAFLSEGPGRNRGNDIIAALAYDSVNVLLQAIQSTGMDDADSVEQALENIHFNGVTGEMTFDQFHNPIKSAVIMAIRQGAVRFETMINP